MKDMPILSVRELHAILSKDSDITLQGLNDLVEKFRPIKGFGTVVEEEIEGEEVILLTNAQVLMLSSKLNGKLRWKLVKSLIDLTESDTIINDVVKASINKNRHRYLENKTLIETYRPLCNLLIPCFDSNFRASTHYMLTIIINRLCTKRQYTPYEVRDHMVERGFLNKDYSINTDLDIRSVNNYIDIPGREAHKVTTPIYMESDLNVVVSTFIKD